ncbi:MAG: ATP-dependent DNA helicase RecQ [Bacteroidota bacterium]
MSELHQLLKKHFGYDAFRPLQEDIIQSVLSKKDTLAILPTGGGKSICFQIPALALGGLCLVVSPLIALMKDQEEQLLQKGIRSAALVSGISRRESDIIIGNCIHGDYRFLYVSPERLSSDLFLKQLANMPVSMIAIDEAHCISQWGYDFRPSYLNISTVRELFPDVPVIALTASATPEVQLDICQKLGFKKGYQTFLKSFSRPNLSYIIRHDENKYEKVLQVLKTVPGTSIIYVRNRNKTQDIAAWLNSNQITADYYHAGLDSMTRAEKQSKWMNNATRVIVATNAFGMGINKENVRSVIHFDIPDDLESYYQEAGRGGRDEKPAFAVLIYGDSDIEQLEEKKEKNFPDIKEIKRIYNALCNHLNIPLESGLNQTYPFDFYQFCNTYQLNGAITKSCLKELEYAGIIAMTEAVYVPAKIKVRFDKMELYNFQVKYQRFDNLIKVILRSYGGVFDYYVKMSEYQISKHLNTDKSTVIALLTELHKLQVIEYLPSSDTPRVTFLHARESTNAMYINPIAIKDRKNRFQVRADAFINYITSNSTCRSMMIASYFGEEKLEKCGTCDICREEKKNKENQEEENKIIELITTLLQQDKLLPIELHQKMPEQYKRKSIIILRMLLEKGIVTTGSDEKLSLKNN